MAEGKLDWGTIRGYVEADFLGTGTSSNNNQSNSYVMRQRVVWAQAALNSGWTFSGGQMWSFATETKKGVSTLSGDIATPQTIDPNYSAGFVWTRQYGFRVTKSIGKSTAVGIAFENPQVLGPGGSINTETGVTYLWGTPGANGGNYNAGGTSTSCSSTLAGTAVTTTCTPSYLTTYAINRRPILSLKLLSTQAGATTKSSVSAAPSATAFIPQRTRWRIRPITTPRWAAASAPACAFPLSRRCWTLAPRAWPAPAWAVTETPPLPT